MTEKKEKEQGKLRRELGLGSVVFFLFGYIVGAGILLQTGTAAAETGPALWLSFIIAGIPNVVSAIIIYYIVSAFPVSGGAWVYTSRLLSPFIAFLVLSSLMIHIIGSLAFISMGFGIYLEGFFPGITYIAAFIILSIFYAINILGVKIAGWVQVILAIFGDFLILVLFIIFGLPNISIENLGGVGDQGLFPTGFLGIFLGAVILSFSYAGFTAIIEIGGEIKNPKKNIPLGIFISLIMVVILYILVSIVMTGVFNFTELSTGVNKTIIDVFTQIGIQGGFLIFLNILILIAIASTIHAVILAYSRDLFSAARDKMLPSFLSEVNEKFGTPHWSVSFFCVSALILLIFQPSYEDLQYLNALTIAVPSLILAFVPYLLGNKYPELLEKSKFKIKKSYLTILVIFNIAYSALSILAIIGVKLYIVLIVAGLYVIGIAYYFIRKKWLANRDIHLEEICKKIPDETLEVI
ncbi:MAG: amino acid permease [Candidatus Lokiarchaeota archaeon]|nr:amino acid permease [Candidatus Lokiarchaeota archaeon]MBD3200978.1 amino acid permease [Candidatus Lokiarchaeota archaeon]